MKKRLIIGILSGILLLEFGDAFLPRVVVHYYIDILFSAAVASLISRKMVAGFVVTIYVLLLKALGLYYLTSGNRGMVSEKAFFWFSLDYSAVIFAGVIGGWIGALLYKYIDRHRTKDIAG